MDNKFLDKMPDGSLAKQYRPSSRVETTSIPVEGIQSNNSENKVDRHLSSESKASTDRAPAKRSTRPPTLSTTLVKIYLGEDETATKLHEEAKTKKRKEDNEMVAQLVNNYIENKNDGIPTAPPKDKQPPRRVKPITKWYIQRSSSAPNPNRQQSPSDQDVKATRGCIVS